MAVSFIEEPRCIFEKTAVVTHSDHSPVVSKATDIIEADDDKQLNECKHFTIRGYVAEVRKTYSKNFWPFLVHDHASLETTNVYPPLPVAKFRWWGCQNCVCEIISSSQMATDGAINVKNQDMKTNNNSLLGKDVTQLGTRRVLSKLPQIFKDNNLKEVLKLNDCIFNISRLAKEKNESPQSDLIGGFQKSKDGQDIQNEIQTVVGEDNCVSNGRSTANKRKRGKHRNYVGRRKSGVAYLKDALGTALLKHKGNKLGKINHSKILDGDATSIRFQFALPISKEYKEPERRRAEKKKRNDFMKGHTKVDMVVGKNDVLNADLAHTFCLGGCCQNRPTYGASVGGSKYIGLTDDKLQIENEVENTHGKKIRKVRFLEDIIRSEKQHAIGNTLDGDLKTIQHDFIRRRVAPKEKVLLLNHTNHEACQHISAKSFSGKSEIQNSLDEDEHESDAVSCKGRINHCGRQRNQQKSVKMKDLHEKFYDEEEGYLLMHWLKNIHKKTNAYEKESDNNLINGSFLLSNFSSDLSDREDWDVDDRDSVVKVHKNKSAFKQKQTLSPKDGQVASSILIGEEMKSKNISSQDICKRSSVIIEKTQHFTKETSHGAGGNAILRSIRNKKPLNDRIELSQKKNSSTQKKATLEVWEKVPKIPRNMRSTDQEAPDDIPMDIVELLARNQHDRHHLIAETDATNKLKLPAMTKSINYACSLGSSKINRINVLDAGQGNISCQKFQVNNKDFDVWTTFPCNNQLEREQKACSCSINGNKKLQIDLNQRYTDSVITGAEFCNLDTNSNCHQLNFSCSRSNNLYSSQSILEDQTVACKNLARNPNHEILQHINGASFGVRSHFLNNLTGSVLGRDLKMFAHSVDYQKPRNHQVGKHHNWGFSPAAPNALSFMDLANGCHSNIFPTDLYSNETISALNLLRLMDQAALSSEPRHHCQSYSGSINETAYGQYNESQSDYESLRKETGTCPLEVVNPSACQPRNSCLLFRPLPRIGILGPSLQKDIFKFSMNNEIPTKNSHGFLRTDVNEKLEPSCLNSNTFPWNSHNSLFRCRCSEKIGSDRDSNRCPDRCSTSNTRFSLVRDSATRVELGNKVDRLPPVGFCEMESCLVNRNPADFTVLDETNEYMIEIKERKNKSVPPSENLRGSVHGQKKQRVMKLNDLKAFAMG